MYKKTNTTKIKIYSRHAKKFKYQGSLLSVINHINRLKMKKHNHFNVCIELENKFQYSFMTKTLSKLGLKGNFLNLKKIVYH